MILEGLLAVSNVIWKNASKFAEKLIRIDLKTHFLWTPIQSFTHLCHHSELYFNVLSHEIMITPINAIVFELLAKKLSKINVHLDILSLEMAHNLIQQFGMGKNHSVYILSPYLLCFSDIKCHRASSTGPVGPGRFLTNIGSTSKKNNFMFYEPQGWNQYFARFAVFLVIPHDCGRKLSTPIDAKLSVASLLRFQLVVVFLRGTPNLHWVQVFWSEILKILAST